MRYKKAQTSMEFVILTAFMLMAFLVFYIAIQSKMIDANRGASEAAAKQVEIIAINEIKVAESVTDGYYREFELPQRINGINYNISVMPGVNNTPEIVIKYSGKERVYFIQQAYIYGGSTIGKGKNKITKTDGKIFIQQCIDACNITSYQIINLYTNWNIISFNINPLNNSINNVFNNTNFQNGDYMWNVSSDVIATYNGGTWTGTISTIDNKTGYRIHVSKDSTIIIYGKTINTNTNISLINGDNLIPYYPTTELDTTKVFKQLIDQGCLKQVTDTYGKTYLDLGAFGGWTNNIGTLKPGQGYIVKTNKTCILNYNVYG